jgi:signal transduction histidine kinase
MEIISGFGIFFVVLAAAVLALFLLANQFLTTMVRRFLQKRLAAENAGMRQLAEELQAVHQELAWKNKRLVELSNKLRQQNTQLSRHNDFQSRLFAMISHDLRNSVGSIFSSLAYFFQEYPGLVQEPARHYLEIAYSASRHVKYLSETLTEYVTLKRDTLRLEGVSVDLENLFSQMKPRFDFEAEKKQITLNWEIQRGLPALHGDPGKLSQLFGNLLHNGIKFTPEGGKVSLKATLQKTMMEIRISDTGVGIPPEEKEKIFGEFYYLKTEKIEKQVGWGLGLAIVKQLVQLHKGRVFVESEGVGKGSTFVCLLPTAMPKQALTAEVVFGKPLAK